MNIRFAKMDDLKEVVDIYNQAIAAGQKTADTVFFTVATRREWFNKHCANKYPLFVAVENDKVLGYLSLCAYRPGREAVQHTLEVSFYIHFSHHRQGIASHLLKHALALCPSLNIQALLAILIEKNKGSIALLENHGFKRWGRLPKIVELDNGKYDHLYYGLHL